MQAATSSSLLKTSLALNKRFTITSTIYLRADADYGQPYHYTINVNVNPSIVIIYRCPLPVAPPLRIIFIQQQCEMHHRLQEMTLCTMKNRLVSTTHDICSS